MFLNVTLIQSLHSICPQFVVVDDTRPRKSARANPGCNTTLRTRKSVVGDITASCRPSVAVRSCKRIPYPGPHLYESGIPGTAAPENRGPSSRRWITCGRRKSIHVSVGWHGSSWSGNRLGRSLGTNVRRWAGQRSSKHPGTVRTVESFIVVWGSSQDAFQSSAEARARRRGGPLCRQSVTSFLHQSSTGFDALQATLKRCFRRSTHSSLVQSRGPRSINRGNKSNNAGCVHFCPSRLR